MTNQIESNNGLKRPDRFLLLMEIRIDPLRGNLPPSLFEFLTKDAVRLLSLQLANRLLNLFIWHGSIDV